MKITVGEAINTLAELEKLGERQTSSGELLKAVYIPASKTRTGFLLGRLQTKLSSIRKDFHIQQEKLITEFGEPLKRKVRDGKGELVEQVVEGQFSVKPDNLSEYTKAVESVLAVEEEISMEPIDFSLLEGIEFPASFWAPMIKFIKE